MMEIITSIKDEKVIEAREIAFLAGRNRIHKFLLEGTEIIDWAIESGLNIYHIFVCDKIGEELYKKYKNEGIVIYQLSEGILKKITDTNYLIPIVGVADVPKTVQSHSSEFCIVLDNVVDFGNIGTIIRTASAFGIEEIISTRLDFDLLTKKTIEASRGKVFDAHLYKMSGVKETINCLKKNNYQIVVTSPRGKDIQSLLTLEPRPIALVVGNETNGVSDELTSNADLVVQIPMVGEVESLNVGVAAGISIYELKLKHILCMLTKNIKSSLGRNFNVASQLIMQAYNRELIKDIDLTSYQLILMMVVECDERISMVDVKKQFTLNDDELNILISPIIAKGFIEIFESDYLKITNIGKETLAKLWTVHENIESKILKGFKNDEKRILKDYINRVHQNCIDIIQS